MHAIHSNLVDLVECSLDPMWDWPIQSTMKTIDEWEQHLYTRGNLDGGIEKSGQMRCNASNASRKPSIDWGYSWFSETWLPVSSTT